MAAGGERLSSAVRVREKGSSSARGGGAGRGAPKGEGKAEEEAAEEEEETATKEVSMGERERVSTARAGERMRGGRDAHMVPMACRKRRAVAWEREGASRGGR